jgi:hypothetical protein
MRKLLLIACCAIVLAACNKPAEEAAKPEPEVKPAPPTELADMKYAEIGKQALAGLSSGDIDKFVSNYADNAKYFWSAGDSLIGKQAIVDFWKNRRTNVIETLEFANDVWLPIKINTPQKGPDRKGVWLVSWVQIKVKYKNGGQVGMWVHMDFHFDDTDKIDQVVMYIDNAPILAALAKKK